MLEPIKFLFILTGASTYLVTKYIKVGLDDPSRTTNVTFHNNESHWNGVGSGGDGSNGFNRSANAIARLSPNNSHSYEYANSANNALGSVGYNLSRNSLMANSRHRAKQHSHHQQEEEQQQQTTNRFHNNQTSSSSSSYHIALIGASNQTNLPALLSPDRSDLASTGTSSSSISYDTNHPEPQGPFRPMFEIEINEEDDRDLPKRLLQITLSTDDNRQVNEVAYYLDGDGTSQSLFIINQTTGEIFVTKPLDRDRPNGQPQYRLNASARNIRTGRTMGYADIVVNLKDINDNYPLFNESTYHVSIAENSSTNQFVTQMMAHDLDDPKHVTNARISYSIEQNQVDQYGQVIFGIDPNDGIIRTLICCLDRERRDNYTIRVVATDGGGFHSSTIVAIKLLDINDEPPRFVRKEWQIEVEENDSVDSSAQLSMTNSSHFTSSILRLYVQDNDLPSTNSMHYWIIGEHHSRTNLKFRDIEQLIDKLDNNYTENFTITTNTDGSASLRIRHPLDYEQPMERFIMLRIAVTDLPFETNHQFHKLDRYHIDLCTVYIKVRDSNDNKPIFAQQLVNVSLSESSIIGTIITKFVATDADQNGHSPILYSLDRMANRRRYFTINSEGFVRLSRPLDRETISTHIVKVIAIDTDEPRLTSTATLIVNVDDVNDNAPQLINDTLPPVAENGPPTRLGDIYAYDRDDYSKGNGPPFTFFMAPDASDQIKRFFRLESDFKGEGKATIHSLVTFDRETQKRYTIPIVIRDGGYPSLSSTCLVNVIIGDLNDNEMKDGWKDVNVFYIDMKFSEMFTPPFKSLHQPIEIGRVNVEDPDDWDSSDKVYFWNEDVIETKFFLNSETGMISMKTLIEGRYELKFSVFDRKYQQRAYSTMRINVQSLPISGVLNTGSLRIVGIDSFQFITTWDWRSRRRVTSIKDRLTDSLRKIIECDQLEIISIVERDRTTLDIRYYAIKNDRFLTSVYLDSIVRIRSEQLKPHLFNISQIGINECMHEDDASSQCDSSSCFTEVSIDWTEPCHLIHGNFTSFVGIRLLTEPKCTCHYDHLLDQLDRHQPLCDIDQTLCSSPSSSSSSSISSTLSSQHHVHSQHHTQMMDQCDQIDRLRMFTRNHRTSMTNLNFMFCASNDDRQSLTNGRSFKGNGWMWLDPLPLCTNNLLSVQIATTELNGLILYHGPVSKDYQRESTDFILLELHEGKIRLLFDFGSGIGEISMLGTNRLNDGNWHHIEVHFDTNRVMIILDHCTDMIQSRFDRCMNSTIIPSFGELLNVNGPLQIGGLYIDDRDLPSFSSSTTNQLDKLNPAIFNYYQTDQNIVGFTGCIRMLQFNSHIYDMVHHVHHSSNSYVGCYSSNSLCSFLNKKCHNNGICDGNYNRVKCICDPFHYGPDCSRQSQPIMFGTRSFVHLSMNKPMTTMNGGLKTLATSNEPSDMNDINHYENGFVTKIDFTFRSRQTQAEIVRLTGRNVQTYCVVEIYNSRIMFRYNLNPNRPKSERTITIDSYIVSDGKWHRIVAKRFGQSAIITLDNGGIGKTNQSIGIEPDEMGNVRVDKYHVFEMNEHQIILGGHVHYLAIGTTTVTNDYIDGCLNNLKINDVHIALDELLQTASNRHPSIEPHSTIDRGESDDDRHSSQKSSMLYHVSITKSMNVRLGCKSIGNPCSSLNCPKPWICSDEWLLAKCRCPAGYLETDDGRNCTSINELCKANPCLCRHGRHRLRQRIQESTSTDSFEPNGSAKLSRLFSDSNQINCSHIDGMNEYDDLDDDDANGNGEQDRQSHRQPTTVNARIFQLEYGLFVIVLVALVPLNIPFIIYIGYICCRNRRRRRRHRLDGQNVQSLSNLNQLKEGKNLNPTRNQLINGSKASIHNDQDIRENVVCYHDEGGGEDDVRAYDMIALRIQIPNQLMSVNGVNDIQYGNHHHPQQQQQQQQQHFVATQSSTTMDKSSTTTDSTGLPYDTWQELTVI